MKEKKKKHWKDGGGGHQHYRQVHSNLVIPFRPRPGKQKKSKEWEDERKAEMKWRELHRLSVPHTFARSLLQVEKREMTIARYAMKAVRFLRKIEYPGQCEDLLQSSIKILSRHWVLKVSESENVAKISGLALGVV